MSRLDLVVGPNGAGKSTFVNLVLAPELPASVFVNADLIAAARWPGEEEPHAYDAAGLAEQARTTLIGAGEPLIAETVFSHPSKLDLIDLAHSRGYVVNLHVLLISEELAVERVRSRVAAGGHGVPEVKIRERYQRLWPLVAAAIVKCNSTRIWDNSSWQGPTLAGVLSFGVPSGRLNLPAWAPEALGGTADGGTGND